MESEGGWRGLSFQRLPFQGSLSAYVEGGGVNTFTQLLEETTLLSSEFYVMFSFE